ncbi:hypothetical protein [Enterobacter hormaechei]|uniref:hypothetical protein n=1 Tax=Enterobacter hormaechei TaxID=158836 RepID=UPI00125427CB|nr:hypothetical protein [Enterobacter hormaechei]VAC65651.1 Uncharacterised protein [Enterobacter hormaechei]
MSTITKEQLRERARQKVKSLELAVTQTAFADSRAELEEELELARIALASIEAEPVALRDERSGSGGISKKPGFNDLQHGTPLYTAPPAPVSVPDERYQHLSELYHAQEKRLFKLAQRIKGASFDKYAYSPSQAIDVLESAIFGEREDECRAAILHGADRPQNEPQNIPENIPATQFEPVADLYGLTSPTGSETSFTFDAVEARDFIDGGWSCQEYVELGRFQVSMLQGAENAESPTTMQTAPELDYSPKNAESPTGINQGKSEPVTTAYKMPEGWVAVPVEPTEDMIVNGLESEPNESFSDEKVWEAYDAMSGCQQAAHRAKLCWAAMISAAPKPDVR